VSVLKETEKPPRDISKQFPLHSDRKETKSQPDKWKKANKQQQKQQQQRKKKKKKKKGKSYLLNLFPQAGIGHL
jgi:Zn-finger nucleic acid-binding protein